MAERSSDPNCCDADAALEYQKFIVEYNKAMTRELPGVVSFDPKVSTREAVTKRNCERTYSVEKIKHGLTGQTNIVVHCDRLYEYIGRHTFDDRNQHRREFAALCKNHPLLNALKDPLRLCYEACTAFGFGGIKDLRQLVNYGYAKGSNTEISDREYSIPEHYEGLHFFESDEAAFEYVWEHFLTDDYDIKKEFEDPYFMAQNAGRFVEYLSHFSEETPQKLISDLFEHIEFCAREIVKSRLDQILDNLVSIGVIAERLSWKVSREGQAIVTINQKDGRESGGRITGSLSKEKARSEERLKWMRELIEQGKGPSQAANIVANKIGGTKGANEQLWYRHKRAQ